ncbi:hypothetical protein E2562_035885, partial [Oryza meyeriana var. granulata]
TYCTCDLGSSFWSTRCGSLYSRRRRRSSEYRLFWGGWLHLQPKWKPSLSWFKNVESHLNHHLLGLFG